MTAPRYEPALTPPEDSLWDRAWDMAADALPNGASADELETLARSNYDALLEEAAERQAEAALERRAFYAGCVL